VSRYEKKHSPTHHSDHHPIFIRFFYLLQSIASSLLKLRAWQSFCTTSPHVLFGLPFGLEPSTSYSIHFFTQSVSSFRNTCPYHRNLFFCSISIISSILSSLLGTLSFFLTLHIHLTILIYACWSATSFSLQFSFNSTKTIWWHTACIFVICCCCNYRRCWQLHQDFSEPDAACNCRQFQPWQVWALLLSVSVLAFIPRNNRCVKFPSQVRIFTA